MTSRKRISRAGSAGRRPRAGRQRAGRRHRRLEAQHGGDRRRRAVERPVEPAERDHRRADRALREDDDARRASRRPLAAASASDQNTTTFAPTTSSRLHSDRPLAQPRRRVLQLVQPRAAGDEAVDRPADQTEQPQLLAGRRIDGEPIGVVGVALRAAHLVGVAVAPDGALAQQPVRREPRAAEHERRPPRVARRARRRDARPPIISTRPPAMKSIEIDSGGPVMPRSKSRATVRSLVSFGSSRWPMPGGRTHASVSRS